MSEPWLSIIGLGEDGLSGLNSASRTALDEADIIFGGMRHLALVEAGERGRAWPVPFSITPVLAARGQRVAVLASGDPFWHGVGGSLSDQLRPHEWRVYPAPSVFSLAAARLGWRIEETLCIGLHAAPFEQLAHRLASGLAAICLVREGTAAAGLAAWLTSRGFGQSRCWLLEALGGPRERITEFEAHAISGADLRTPVAVAFIAEGGPGLQCTPGLPNDSFVHDGQITKRPIRALTLSALAPRPGERLWDIGAGSGTVSIEWVLACGGGSSAIAIEVHAERVRNILTNARAFGVEDRISAIEGEAPAALAGLPEPHAVFLGGGADEAMLQAVWNVMRPGARLVANAVTLETEALFSRWSSEKGGSLLRIELAEEKPLGRYRSWAPARPIVQWSVTR
jgi:precorrin-6B C5,15-methyltransferase / cobalt-precorrin-6B C5,C15-methyltransferase